MDQITFIDRNNTYIDPSVKIGKNVTIYPNNYILNNTIIGDNCTLLPGNYITNCKIGEGNKIAFSYLEESIIKSNCQIGPYAHIRPNSTILDGAKIGNFVEVKKSIIGEKTKASHLAYIGDAKIGKECNIGCGAIFVNYNGKEKHESVVCDNCFIGSNANIIAPVNLKSKTYVCAGTTVTKSTNENDFVIGRVNAEIKPNRANKYIN